MYSSQTFNNVLRLTTTETAYRKAFIFQQSIRLSVTITNKHKVMDYREVCSPLS